jgi:hypothetical protein
MPVVRRRAGEVLGEAARGSEIAELKRAHEPALVPVPAWTALERAADLGRCQDAAGRAPLIALPSGIRRHAPSPPVVVMPSPLALARPRLRAGHGPPDDELVAVGVEGDRRRATCPTRRRPSSVNATTDGVVRPPSAFGMTSARPPSMTAATTELVVPRSIPTVLAI